MSCTIVTTSAGEMTFMRASLRPKWRGAVRLDKGIAVSNAQVWHAAQERLRREMTRAQFETWLRGTHLRAADDGATILNVRTTFAKELLENRYRERIAAVIAEVTGRPCALRIMVAPATVESLAEAAPVTPTAATRTATRPSATQRALCSAGTRYARPSLFALAQEPERASPERASPERASPERASPETPGARPEPEPLVARALPRATTLASTRRRGAPSASGHGGEKRARVRAAVERSQMGAATKPHEPRDQEEWRMPPSGAHGDTMSGGVDQPARGGAPRAPDATGDEPMSTGGYDDPRPPRARPPRERPATSGSPERGDPPALPTLAPTTPAGAVNASAVNASAVNASAVNASASLVPVPRLNARYTFDTFIVGSTNQLAHAASQAVAEAPGQAYNPLFLYGDVGLGKTHLLHAIGHTAIENGLTVLYVSSATFTNEIINAIRYRTTEECRAKYRLVDVLLVDDIQFIAGKESTEEEFFHTFNSLYENSKQIVICSDRPPKAIVSLEGRLRSRFEWGLIADIQPPELETRVAILRAKADMTPSHVPDEILTYLASNVQSNIRELEGSFNRLLAIAQLQGKPLTIETARAALSNLATDGKQRHVGTSEVLGAVAQHYRIPLEDLQGKQRDKHIVVPRQVAMYLMRQETEASLLEIGQTLGGRDHSTVLHGCEKISREINENTALRKEVQAIRQQLFG
ncbi:MAG: chromosomal replication initiator protein DnaA [Ktedonobacterales bacterium]|nr:chromosomal replication initiator protein DnaA [Ktedonobacterales bacterium]